MFTKAVKTDAKLRMAITGPSGAGKTYSALAIATALADGQPIAVVDTEHGSASKYADLFEFDVAEMHAPFHPDKYIKAIGEAAQAGYSVIILDSLSHAWIGTGGLLDLVDEIAKRKSGGNTFAAWKDATPIQNRLIDAIVSGDIHIIATMRSKQDFVQDKDDRGKTVIRKVGMAPQQRDGFEYEFDVVMAMDIDNNGIIEKTRCPALTGRVLPKPGADVAGILAQWLHGAPKPPVSPQKPAQEAQQAPVPVQATNEAPNAPHNGSTLPDVSADEAFGGMDKRGDVAWATLQRLDELGAAFYGEGWNAKIPELCEHASGGGTQRAAELYEAEAQVLIRGIEKRMKAAVTA